MVKRILFLIGCQFSLAAILTAFSPSSASAYSHAGYAPYNYPYYTEQYYYPPYYPVEPVNLKINVSDGKTAAVPGETSTYTITIRNQSPIAARGLVVKASLSSGLSLITASDSPIEYGRNLTWVLPVIAANESVRLTVTARLNDLFTSRIRENVTLTAWVQSGPSAKDVTSVYRYEQVPYPYYYHERNYPYDYDRDSYYYDRWQRVNRSYRPQRYRDPYDPYYPYYQR